MPEAADPYQSMSTRRIATRLGGAVLLILAVVAGLGLLVRDPLEALADRLVARAGLVGIGALVFVGDPLPGVGFQPALLLGIAAGVHELPLYLVTAAGTFASALASYGVGRAAGHLPLLRRLLQVSGTEAAIDRWGFRALLVSAVLPLPWGLATLAWGAHGLPFRLLVASALARWLKVAAFLAAFVAGWSVTG